MTGIHGFLVYYLNIVVKIFYVAGRVWTQMQDIETVLNSKKLYCFVF